MRHPGFFIVGGPKCGTTSIAGWLAGNPHVYMAPVKEPHFFSTDLRIDNRPVTTDDGYRALFAAATAGHAAVGEASVSYLYSRNAVPAIIARWPEARFVVCIRNPVDMAYSLHGQGLLTGNEHLADFEEAWDALDERLRGNRISPRCQALWTLLYGPVCSLGAQLERAVAAAGRHRVLPLLLDDVEADPAAAYRRVLRFLEVPDDGRDRFPALNVASRRRFPRLHAAAQGAVRLRRAVGLPPLGIPFLRWLERMNRAPSDRPPLGPLMHARLVEYFADDIARLEQLLDRDLTHWRHPHA